MRKLATDENPVPLVDNPFHIKFEEQSSGYYTTTITDKDNVIGFGLYIDGDPAYFNEFVSDMVDGEYIIDAPTELNYNEYADTNFNWVSTLACQLEIWVSDIEIAEMLKEEFTALIDAYGDLFLIKYKNEPEIELIQANYIGG
jgi:hypothetical protein